MLWRAPRVRSRLSYGGITPRRGLFRRHLSGEGPTAWRRRSACGWRTVRAMLVRRAVRCVARGSSSDRVLHVLSLRGSMAPANAARALSLFAMLARATRDEHVRTADATRIAIRIATRIAMLVTVASTEWLRCRPIGDSRTTAARLSEQADADSRAVVAFEADADRGAATAT